MSTNSQTPNASSSTGKKPQTYGGSRAWSEEEESFLLESRQRKTPYKHIASYLQKTELACRLHYHQLAYGTKRKRRCTSASSTSTTFGDGNVPSATRGHTPQKSIDSTASHHSSRPPHMALPAFSPPTSPLLRPAKRLARSESPPNEHQLAVPVIRATPATSSIPSREQFSPLQQLPRLAFSGVSNQDHRWRYSSTVEPLFGAHGATLPNPSTSFAAPPTSLRSSDFFNTNLPGSSAPQSVIDPSELYHVDPARLDRCYRMHRHSFWSTVARDYGDNLDPFLLEAAFLRQHAASPVNSLPTPPNRSPVLLPVVLAEDVESGKVTVEAAGEAPGDRKGKTGASSYSIASILTEDQEVYGSRRQTV